MGHPTTIAQTQPHDLDVHSESSVVSHWYLQVTVELPETLQEVWTVLLCLMFRIEAPDTPTVLPELVVTLAPVKVTVPKLANGTRELPCEKSSTIHSASVSQSLAVWPEKECVTVLPVLRLVRVTEPALVLVALAVILIWLPAAMGKPAKLYA